MPVLHILNVLSLYDILQKRHEYQSKASVKFHYEWTIIFIHLSSFGNEQFCILTKHLFAMDYSLYQLNICWRWFFYRTCIKIASAFEKTLRA